MLSQEEQAEHLIGLANQKIYFGKHKGQFILDLPEPYLLWLKKQDLDSKKLRDTVEEICSLKENGLEGLVRKFRRK